MGLIPIGLRDSLHGSVYQSREILESPYKGAARRVLGLVRGFVGCREYMERGSVGQGVMGSRVTVGQRISERRVAFVRCVAS